MRLSLRFGWLWRQGRYLLSKDHVTDQCAIDPAYAAQTRRERTPVGINQLGPQVLDRRAVIMTIFTMSLNDSPPL